MGKEIVRMKRLNWDIEYMFDILSGKGFTITQPAEVKMDKESIKAMYGARSPLFGTSYEDEQSFIERYRCKCGAFMGKQFNGEICPLCNTEVTCKGVDVEFTGWISFGEGNRIINPYYYKLLNDCIGAKNFDAIINTKKRVDKNGQIHTFVPDDTDKKPPHPFVGLGITAFYDRFEEILNYFKVKKKNKTKSIEIILNEKSSVFTTHYPVYSTILRPQSTTENTYYFNSIDKQINPLYSLSESIKNTTELERDYVLQRIQTRVNTLWDLNFDLIIGKSGFIRGQILGGALNYTSRNVIVPDPTLRENEVDISYGSMLEMYKYRIIYYLMKIENITLAKAYNRWAYGFMFDKKIYKIMEYIIETEGCYLLINRNPTLNYYSLLLMKVRHVRKPDDEFVLAIPLSILPGLNADFDGDILNIIALMDKYLVKCFKKFDPITRMIISRDTGELHPYFSLEKSQTIDLHYFCTVK